MRSPVAKTPPEPALRQAIGVSTKIMCHKIGKEVSFNFEIGKVQS